MNIRSSLRHKLCPWRKLLEAKGFMRCCAVAPLGLQLDSADDFGVNLRHAAFGLTETRAGGKSGGLGDFALFGFGVRQSVQACVFQAKHIDKVVVPHLNDKAVGPAFLARVYEREYVRFLQVGLAIFLQNDFEYLSACFI